MNPKLSVVIPCYNAGRYIGELLDCCIKQTYKDWEVIVVDDGSTDDDTHKVLNDYRSKDPRIKIIDRHRQPKGGDTCRNIGMERAKGEYLIIFDADDLISNDCFENRVRFIEDNKDCDFASFPAACFYDGTTLPRWADVKKFFGLKKGNHDNLYYLLTYNYPYTVWSNIYRYASVKEIKWDEKILVMQDFDWMVSCELKGLRHKYFNKEKIDYYYRQFLDGHNVCGTYTGKSKCQSTYYLFEKTLSRLQVRKDYEKRRAQFYSYVTVHLNRLLTGGEYEEVERFIDLCSRFYSKQKVTPLRKVAATYLQKKKEKVDGVLSPTLLFFYCTVYYKSGRYFVLFLKNLIKKVIGREK